MDEPYEIRRSARRRKTVTAFREDGRLVVVVPQHLSRRQIDALAPGLVAKVLAKEASGRAPRGDAELTARVRSLYARHLQPAVGAPPPDLGARWVTNQERRWGSCTPGTGEIRISDRLRPMPDWVVDFVLVHEAAHLVERDHSPRFRALEARYPDAERARAFLEGVEFARSHPEQTRTPRA